MIRKFTTVEDFVCDESFQQYCIGLNKKVVQSWDGWIKNHPENSIHIEEAKKIVNILNAGQGNLIQQSHLLQDHIFRYDFLREHIDNSNAGIHLKKQTAKNWPLYISGIAAGLLLIFFSFQYFFKSGLSDHKKESGSSYIASKDALRKTVVLPDGSTITLHQNSQMVLAKDFSLHHRELSLSGEAYFDIKHDEQNPFKIHTPQIDITVLGTRFNVKAYPNESFTETTLFKGKVGVTSRSEPGKMIFLKPNEKMVFTNSANPQKTANLKNRDYVIIPVKTDKEAKIKEIDWVQNQLKIDDETLLVIAARLEKWYGIKIQFAGDEVKNYRYSGTFESESILQALDALKLSFPFNYQVKNDAIVISK